MSELRYRYRLCAKCKHRVSTEKTAPLCPKCFRGYRCPRCGNLDVHRPRRALCEACVRDTGHAALPRRRWYGSPCPRRELPFREAYYAARAADRLPLFDGAPWLNAKANENFVCAYCHASYELREDGEKYCCSDCTEDAYTDFELSRLFPLKIGMGWESWPRRGVVKVQMSDEACHDT